MPTWSEIVTGGGLAVILWRVARWIGPKILERWTALEVSQTETHRLVREIGQDLREHLARHEEQQKLVNHRLDVVERALGITE